MSLKKKEKENEYSKIEQIDKVFTLSRTILTLLQKHSLDRFKLSKFLTVLKPSLKQLSRKSKFLTIGKNVKNNER